MTGLIGNIARWIAWHLPKVLVMWCYARVASFVTITDDKPPTEIDLMRGLEVWAGWMEYEPKKHMITLAKVLVVGGFAVIMVSLFLVNWWLSFCGLVMLLISVPVTNTPEVQKWLKDSSPDKKEADVE